MVFETDYRSQNSRKTNELLDIIKLEEDAHFWVEFCP